MVNKYIVQIERALKGVAFFIVDTENQARKYSFYCLEFSIDEDRLSLFQKAFQDGLNSVDILNDSEQREIRNCIIWGQFYQDIARQIIHELRQ